MKPSVLPPFCLVGTAIGLFLVPMRGQTVEKNSTDGMEYVSITSGSFQMGCSPGDTLCQSDERPRHEVTISRGFRIGRTEATVAAYKRFAEATGRKLPDEPSLMGSSLNRDWGESQQPMVNVPWEAAQSYCEWVGGRLPTEAEWEYAARAGENGARYGSLNEIAWSADNSGGQMIDSHKIWVRDAGSDAGRYLQLLIAYGRRIPHVGLKRPNAWKLFDMLGSVYEWTEDWYSPDFYRQSDSTNPVNRTRTQLRVTRGGSWGNVPDYLRLSARSWSAADAGYSHIGFRCVLPEL